MKRSNQLLLQINTGSLLLAAPNATSGSRYFVVVGSSPLEFAMVCLYPKDELNTDVQFLRNLKDYFLPVTIEELPETEFVADCSRIIVQLFGAVATWLGKNGQAGPQIPEHYLSDIVDKIAHAVTISPYQKKEYNLFSIPYHN